MDLEIHYRRLLEQYGNGHIDRRAFLGRIGLLALGVGMTGTAMVSLTKMARAQAKSIRFDSYGGVFQAAMDKHIMQPFTAKTGIAVNQGSFGNPDELLAKLRAEGTGAYNVFSCADESTAVRFIEGGYAVELDESKIPRLKDLMPAAVNSYRKVFNGKIPSVPTGLSGVWLGYNRDKISKAEIDAKGFNILLDEKYKGAMTGEDYWIRRIWYAAVQSNQDPNNIKNMDVVWDKIRESKKLVLKYFATGAEQMQLFSSGSVILGDAWFVRIYNLKKQGVPVEGYPQKGTYVTFASLMPLKGTPMDAYYEMVDILLRPEVAFPMSIEVGNSPLLDPTKFQVPAEAAAIPGFDPTGKLDGYATLDPKYWSSNADNWQRQYQRVMART